MITVLFLILFCTQRETTVNPECEQAYSTTLENDSLVIRSHDEKVFGAVNWCCDNITTAVNPIECTITDSILTIKSLWTDELVHTKDFKVTKKENIHDRIYPDCE